MNYYELLGVPRKSSREDIRAAYLRLAQEVHPDRHVGSGEDEIAEREKFKQIQQAYEVLYDNAKRADYDLRHGSIPQRRAQPAQRAEAGPSYQGPVRSAPGVRRDVPDDWVRGGGGQKRALQIFRLVALAVILAAVVSTIPRCSRYLEAQLTTVLPDPDANESTVADVIRRENENKAAVLSKASDEATSSDETISKPSAPPQQMADLKPHDAPPQSIVDYTLQEMKEFSDSEPELAEPTFNFSNVVASQDGTAAPPVWEPSVPTAPAAPTLPTANLRSEPEPLDWTPPSSRTNQILNGQPPSFAESPNSATLQRQPMAPRSHSPYGSNLIPQTPPIVPEPNKFDNLRPNILGNGRLPGGDRYKDRMGSAFRAPPAIDQSAFPRPSFPGLEPPGFDNLKTEAGLNRIPGGISSPRYNSGFNSDRYSPSSRSSRRPSY